MINQLFANLALGRNTVWAMMPEAFERMLAVAKMPVTAALAESFNAAIASHSSSVRGVAVISVAGMILQRVHPLFEMLGWATSAERLGVRVAAAVNDPDVGAIVLDIDSPGGSVYGVNEVADAIFAMRPQKKIVAVANSLAASAAYWIASAADEIVVTPSGEVGSIGVVAMHEDWSMFLGNAESPNGLPKMTLVHAGKYKVEGSSMEPLEGEALDFLQSRVNDYYSDFVKAVARNRGDSVGAVRDGYGQGRVLGAKAAVDSKLADRVETMSETINRLMTSKRAQSSRRRAESRLTIEEMS